MRKSIFIVLMLCSLGQAADPNANFTCTGFVSGIGTSFLVNEEIVFDASATTFDPNSDGPDTTNRMGYTWDFGNGITTGTNRGGISVVQTYKKPGTYTVTLNVLDDEARTDDEIVSITVTGSTYHNPPRTESTSKALELKFSSDSLADTSPNAHTPVWVGENPASYPDHSTIVEGNAIDLTNGYIRVPDAASLDGFTTGITLSIWFKRASTGDAGYLLHKPGVFSLRTFVSGTQRPMEAVIYAGGSSATCTNWSFTTDTLWHHIIVVYNPITELMTLYTDGVLQEAVAGQAQKSLSGNVATSADDLYVGAKSDGTNLWTGIIDEVKVINRSITTEEMLYSYESLHGDFHGRIKQVIDYKIPAEFTSDAGNQLKVTLTGALGSSDVVYEKTSTLTATESFTFDQSELVADTYTLTSQILGDEDVELDSIVEPFIKTYAGIPSVGIDENNSICLDGVPYFPVTSFGLNNASIPDWTTDRVTHPEYTDADPASALVNTLTSYGFWPKDHTVEGWGTYLGLAGAAGVKAIGPGFWNIGTYASQTYCGRYSDTSSLIQYVQAYNDNACQIAWGWKDEPDLGGPTEEIPPNVIRSWSFLSHKYSGEQLTYTNLCGPNYVYTAYSRPSSYTYLGTKAALGTNRSIADIISFDYYPYDWRITRRAQDCSIAGYVAGVKLLIEENPYNPVMNFIETADIRDDVNLIKKDKTKGYYSDLTPTITVDQIKMLCWLNVVSGVKGISWFPFFRDFSPYTTGTVTVVNGSTTVTGSSVMWEPIFDGRDIIINGTACVVSSVTMGEGETYSITLELTSPWAGANGSGLTYSIDGNWDNWNAMAQFTADITTLAPVVLSADTAYTMTVDEEEGTIRTMMKESGGNIYVIAVRQTEVIGPKEDSSIGEAPGYAVPTPGYYNAASEWVEYGSTGDNVPVTDQSVRFTIAECLGNTVTVWGEDRTITPTGTYFEDDFDACDVHIYIFSNTANTGVIMPYYIKPTVNRFWRW